MGISIVTAKEVLLQRNRKAGIVGTSFYGRKRRKIPMEEKGKVEAKTYAEDMFLLFHGEKNNR